VSPTATKQRRAAKAAKPKASGASRRVTNAAKPKAANAARRVTNAAKPKAANAARRVTNAAKPSAVPGPSGFGRVIARKALKAMVRGAVLAGAAAARAAADKASEVGTNVVETGLSKRLPIQVSIDVAVPLNVAWDEWMKFESLTEGVHHVEDVERDGDYLYGRTAGPRPKEWEAEITDERLHESFAWRSVKGSDCAGLVTFHRLSDRLTRIELDLDVLPTNPTEAFALALHLAHHRAETELRRFKARVEFINPDVYEANEDGSQPHDDKPHDDEPHDDELRDDEPE
jgi:uncharacterized membrane protein